MAQPALARPVLTPPAYTHKGEAWTDWLQQFEAACEVNGYAAGDRLRFLAARLEGTAHQIFQTIRAANAQATYPQMVTLLTAHFEPPQQEPLHEAEFRIRRKLPTESQITFAAALRSLANRAFPGQAGALFERMLLQQFIEGQISAEVRLQLASHRPQDVSTAVQRAVEIEGAYHLEALRSASSLSLPVASANAVSAASLAAGSVPSRDASPDTSTDLIRLLRRIDEKLDRLSLQSNTSSSSPRSGSSSSGRGRGSIQNGTPRTCFRCGQAGHFVSACPQRTHTSGNSPHSQGDVSNLSGNRQ